jgi:hypothetical protein
MRERSKQDMRTAKATPKPPLGSISMTAPTRRAALTALIGAPALALPAVAVAAPPDADAEILALRAEFERLQAIYLPLRETYEPQELLYAEMAREQGMDVADAWGKQSGFWAVNDQVADVGLSMGSLAERMTALRRSSRPPPDASAGLLFAVIVREPTRADGRFYCGARNLPPRSGAPILPRGSPVPWGFFCA